MSQRWRAVGNDESDLTGPRFERQTSRSKDERVTTRPTGRCIVHYFKNFEALLLYAPKIFVYPNFWSFMVLFRKQKRIKQKQKDRIARMKKMPGVETF